MESNMRTCLSYIYIESYMQKGLNFMVLDFIYLYISKGISIFQYFAM